MRWLGSSALKLVFVAVNSLHDNGMSDSQINVAGMDHTHARDWRAANLTPTGKGDLAEPEPANDPVVWFSGTNPSGSFWTGLLWLSRARCIQR